MVKIAVVHEWLTTYAGSEKVLEAILSEFPNADLYCLIDYLPVKHRKNFRDKNIQTTALQWIPFVKNIYRYLLYIMPFAVEQFDLSEYDITVISNCHSVAKGVLTSSCQLHICYCYTPMRYAWDLQERSWQNLAFGAVSAAWSHDGCFIKFAPGTIVWHRMLIIS